MSMLLDVADIRGRDLTSETAIDRVSLGLERASIGLLIGGPHAGKSLLLRLIAGECLPISGRIAFDGKDVSLAPVWRRRRQGIALASQSPPRFDLMTAEEQICLGLRRRALSTKLKRALMAHLPEVGPLLATRMYKLSRQAHRLVDVASCVLQNPAVLLLDEPAVDFGPDRAIELISSLKRLDMAILVADRYAGPLLDIADRAWLIHRGKLIRSGPAADFRDDPAVLAASLGDEVAETL